MEPPQWRPFVSGSAASYLGVSPEVLNERQAKAKGEDLVEQGKQLSAAVRTKIITKDPESVSQKRKRETEQKPKGKSGCSVFGKLVEDDKGLYLVTPVPTKVTVGASTMALIPDWKSTCA